MREFPSCVVELRRFGVWRAAVCIGAGAAIAAMTAWAGSAIGDRSSDAALITAVASLLAVMSALMAMLLARVEHGRLACVDGGWSFTFRDRGDDRIESSTLAVAVGLGSFRLKLILADSARRWLPVQRRGREGDRHAPHCAVYSPPPAALSATSISAAASEPLPE